MPSNIAVTVRGVEYPTIKEACQAHNVDPGVVLWRRRVHGMSIEKAIITPVGQYQRGLVIKGIRFETKQNACEYFKIPTATFHSRLQYGWSVEKALLTPVRKYRKYPKEDSNGSQQDVVSQSRH